MFKKSDNVNDIFLKKKKNFPHPYIHPYTQI